MNRLVARFRPAWPLLALSSVLACGSAPPPEPTSTAPEPEAEAAVVPDGPAPPMYEPSSSSPAPMPITDPAYGAYRAAPRAPTLGDTLPDFTVALADGGTFSLAEARKAGPVLVMFYRGFW